MLEFLNNTQLDTHAGRSPMNE